MAGLVGSRARSDLRSLPAVLAAPGTAGNLVACWRGRLELRAAPHWRTFVGALVLDCYRFSPAPAISAGCIAVDAFVVAMQVCIRVQGVRLE